MQASWVDKMLERIRNVIKSDKKKFKATDDSEEIPTPKRGHKVKADDLSHRYPVMMSAADETLQQHHKAIEEELTKPKPRDRVLLPLMKSTFATRWLFVKNDARNVKDIFPALKLPTIVRFMHIYSSITIRIAACMLMTLHQCS